jgi:hypothetical protein
VAGNGKLTLSRGRKFVGKDAGDIRVFEVKAGQKHVGYLYSQPNGAWVARGRDQFHHVTATARSAKDSPEEVQQKALIKLEAKLKGKGAI